MQPDPCHSLLLLPQVFPAAMVAVLFAGFSGEVWIKPGAEPSQGAVYRAKRGGGQAGGQVCAVLGAGGWAG